MDNCIISFSVSLSFPFCLFGSCLVTCPLYCKLVAVFTLFTLFIHFLHFDSISSVGLVATLFNCCKIFMDYLTSAVFVVVVAVVIVVVVVFVFVVVVVVCFLLPRP